jgi:sugar transferase (PEP-CTERM/EpsH1 system associated)
VKKPIHILQVVHSLVIGGTERVVCDLVRAFNNDEFCTSICCLDELGEFGEELRSKGYDVKVLGRRPGIDLNLVRRLRKVYRQQNVDLIHAHQYTPYFYAASASLFNGGTQVIFTEHGRHYPDRIRPKRAFFNQVLRFCTVSYTGVSEFTRQSLIRYEKMPASRIRVIYNGIQLDGNYNGCANPAIVRTSLGLKKTDLLILSVGRMDPVKDFETLIKAFSFIAQGLPHASLWIVGGGDSNYSEQLVRLIEELGMESKITLLGSRRDVSQLLFACDLFVLPSITEATSMTILEAMASGRAVVATQTGGNPEIVIHGQTGLLVPVGDVAALSQAMDQLLRGTSLREVMGKAGRSRIEKNFTMEHILLEYEELYREAVGMPDEKGALKQENLHR